MSSAGAITGGRGRPGRQLATIAQGYFTDLPDMQVYLDHVVVEGDRIEYHWTFTGTNTGPGGTGKEYERQLERGI